MLSNWNTWRFFLHAVGVFFCSRGDFFRLVIFFRGDFFREVIFSRVIFSGVIFSVVIFSGVIFSGVIFTDAYVHM